MTAGFLSGALSGYVDFLENLWKLCRGLLGCFSDSLGRVCLLTQDNNGVIGLLEPMKTSSVPVLLQLSSPVIKIVSGEPDPGCARVRLLDEAVSALAGG